MKDTYESSTTPDAHAAFGKIAPVADRLFAELPAREKETPDTSGLFAALRLHHRDVIRNFFRYPRN